MKGRVETVVDLTVIEGYVWCHAHGEVHGDTSNPYDMDNENCSEHHVVLYAEKSEYES